MLDNIGRRLEVSLISHHSHQSSRVYRVSAQDTTAALYAMGLLFLALNSMVLAAGLAVGIGTIMLYSQMPVGADSTVMTLIYGSGASDTCQLTVTRSLHTHSLFLNSLHCPRCTLRDCVDGRMFLPHESNLYTVGRQRPAGSEGVTYITLTLTRILPPAHRSTSC